MNKKTLDRVNSTFVTLVALSLAIVFLSPFAFMIFTSLKTREQISVVGAPIWPAAQPKFTYAGKGQDVFKVPLAQCAGFDTNSTAIKNLALVKKGRQESTFVDPANIAKGEFVCTVSWRALDRPWIFSPTWGNYKEVWNTIPNGYWRLLGNTSFYALVTMIGTVISCILVAYGFARFRFPGGDYPLHSDAQRLAGRFYDPPFDGSPLTVEELHVFVRPHANHPRSVMELVADDGDLVADVQRIGVVDAVMHF